MWVGKSVKKNLLICLQQTGESEVQVRDPPQVAFMYWISLLGPAMYPPIAPKDLVKVLYRLGFSLVR